MWIKKRNHSLSLPHPHKAATHNACALVRAMASNTRKADTDDERALCAAALKKNVKILTSLLQKGVCPNIYDHVCWHEMKRECEEEKEEEEGGEMRERESLFIFSSSWMLTFFSGRCKFLSPSCLWMRWWRVKAGAFVCERVWRTSTLGREREKRTKERRREREGRRRKREREREWFLFFIHISFF